VVGLDVVLQTGYDNQGPLLRFQSLAWFHPLGVKHGTRHCYSQTGEQLYLICQHQCPVQYILGSDALWFLRTLIFIQNDVPRLADILP